MTTPLPAGVPPEAAEMFGWNDTSIDVLNRITRGIEYCRENQDDEDGKDLLCCLMLTYEERFGALSPAIHTRVESLFCTKEAA